MRVSLLVLMELLYSRVITILRLTKPYTVPIIYFMPPGGCKASSLFGGMMPVSDNGNSPVMSSARKFCNMFSSDDTGYEA